MIQKFEFAVGKFRPILSVNPAGVLVVDPYNAGKLCTHLDFRQYQIDELGGSKNE